MNEETEEDVAVHTEMERIISVVEGLQEEQVDESEFSRLRNYQSITMDLVQSSVRCRTRQFRAQA